MQEPVFVIGMHRSGTSLVAQALAAAGFFAGESSDMLEAQQDNPLGFFERRDVVAQNDRLLAASGGSWFDPPASAPIADAVFTGASQQLRSNLYGAAGDAHATFLKDPRFCLTWKVWLEAFPGACVVYVYRSPLAVARSLRHRNGFPLGFGLALWEHYNRMAVGALRERPFVALSYEQVARDPAVLNTMLARLQELGLTGISDTVPAVFSADLQHAAIDPVDRGAAALLSFEQTLLAGYCEALCAGGPVLPLPAATPSLQAKMQDYAQALSPLATVLETGIALTEARALCDERTGERDRVLQEQKVLAGEHRELATAHDRELSAHRQTMAERDRVLSELQAANTRHAELAQAHRVQVEEYAALAARHSQLSEDFGELEEKSKYLFHSLSETYRGLLTYEQSSLAKVQNLFGRGYKLLTGQRGVNSRHDDLLQNAQTFVAEYAIDIPRPRRGKLAMLLGIGRYMLANPAASLRSFSWPRLQRGVSVFLGSSAADLQVWVNARFPDQAAPAFAFDPASLSPDLDTLELTFPAADHPAVSIVVPVYNDYRVTVNCLQSLLEHTPAGQYEVLLADDGSSDLTASIEARVHGLSVVRGDANVGFLRNCNRAALQARGEFVLLLNNDTAVTEGWLQPLLRVFEDASVGAAGPQLLFADGVLQEAGGIMWRDGSAWNFGRGDDAARPAYSYLKEVDYISGACLMLRRTLWDKLGGFDERFVPAYYEDADICFAVRQAGYRVMYQPASRVFHFEGVSNGTDLAAGIKQHQVTNQQVFADKWQDELTARHFANAEHVTWARDRSAQRRCVLFIDHYVPHHDKDAGSRSTFMYVELLLSLGYRVQFMGANFFAHQPYTQLLQQLGVEVLVGEAVARHLDSWFAEHAPYIDEIFLHRPHVAEQFLPHLKKLAACPPISYFGHDLHYLRINREAAVLGDDALRRSAESWRRREYAVFDQVDRIYYFSAVETDEIRASKPQLALRTLPLYALADKPLPDYTPQQPLHMLFVGGFNHPPNVDAASWFVAEVMPAIRARCPGAHLHLVGSNPNEEIHALASPLVTVHGFLTDAALDALYRKVGLAVVPLRYGAGVKGKVLDAVQQNVPLLTTSVGAEGIPDAGEVMWIADDADALAERAADLLCGDAESGERMAAYGSWLHAHFSKERACAELLRDLQPAQRSQP